MAFLAGNVWSGNSLLNLRGPVDGKIDPGYLCCNHQLELGPMSIFSSTVKFEMFLKFLFSLCGSDDRMMIDLGLIIGLVLLLWIMISAYDLFWIVSDGLLVG